RFTNSGKYVVVGDAKGSTVLWNPRTKRALQSYAAHRDKVNEVVVSARDEYVLTAGRDGVAQIFELATGKPICRLTGHTGAILSAAFSADAKFAVTGGKDNSIRVWATATGALVRQIPAQSAVWVLRPSPDGLSVSAGESEGVL